MAELRKMKARFALRIKTGPTPENGFSFFLGGGCSIMEASQMTGTYSVSWMGAYFVCDTLSSRLN